jgi:transposase
MSKPASLFAAPLSAIEQSSLQAMYRHHDNYYTRQRAHGVLLSSEAWSVREIAAILGVHRQSVASWLHAWEHEGLCGLLEKPRSGRPKHLEEAEIELALELVNDNPRTLKKALSLLEEQTGKTISTQTLKRLCKQAGMSWKRVRKSLKSRRDDDAFDRVVTILAALIPHAQQGRIDFYYFDESGFSLTPCVPYAWQPLGETIALPSQRSQQLNVLGLMKHSGELKSFVFDGTIDSAVVCACFDQWVKGLEKKTFVLIDNAPMHRSEAFQARLKAWRKQGLVIIFNAPYAPELNLIEILWHQIKYAWMPFSAYQSLAQLKHHLFDILNGIGSEYRIDFASA